MDERCSGVCRGLLSRFISVNVVRLVRLGDVVDKVEETMAKRLVSRDSPTRLSRDRRPMTHR